MAWTNPLQLSLYWESDLRILSYFLNKRKELEYNIWNPADLQYLATLVRGKVTKTIELQGISQYWKGNEGPFTSWRHFEQQKSWRFCCWELKMLVTLHGLLCSTWQFYQIFVKFFVIFWYQSWFEQTSESDLLYFFSMKDILHWSKKITRQGHDILESTQKV